MQNSANEAREKSACEKARRATDARSVRTRGRLSWSLIELIQEKGFDATTVQDIAKRAEVGRSTFYSHFSDKDDVFLNHFVGFMQSFGAQLCLDDESRSYRLPVAKIFEHVQEMRPLLMAMMKAHKLDHMLKIGRIVLAESIESKIQDLALDDAHHPSTLPAKLVAQHLAGTFLNLLMWWMDHHQPYSPLQMDEYFHSLIAGR